MNYADIKNPRKHRLLCAISGRPADDAHHLNLKGMGGRGERAENSDDATPLCRAVHDLRHAEHIAIWRGSDGTLRFRADTERGESALRRMGVHTRRNQERTALYEGKTYDDPVEPEDDPDDEFLASMYEQFSIVDKAEESAYFMRAKILHAVRGAVGKKRFADWVVGTCRMSKPTASRSCTIIEYLGDLADPDLYADGLPASTAYHLARGVKQGKFTAQEAVDELANSTLHDMVERYGLAAKRESREPVLVCPSCAASHPLSEYERSAE